VTAGVVYAGGALVDTCAVVALLDEKDDFHQQATEFYAAAGTEIQSWFSVDVTAHEAFTRGRYRTSLTRGLDHFAFLREQTTMVRFIEEDEDAAHALLKKYLDQKLSFHDALCAAVMKRLRIYRVFSFDSDFWVFGFEVFPGMTRRR
jgi:uncharacterized protein